MTQEQLNDLMNYAADLNRRAASQRGRLLVGNIPAGRRKTFEKRLHVLEQERVVANSAYLDAIRASRVLGSALRGNVVTSVHVEEAYSTPDPAPGPNGLIGTREAARYLECGFSTLNEWCRDGRGPFFTQRGPKRFFALHDLKTFKGIAS